MLIKTKQQLASEVCMLHIFFWKNVPHTCIKKVLLNSLTAIKSVHAYEKNKGIHCHKTDICFCYVKLINYSLFFPVDNMN